MLVLRSRRAALADLRNEPTLIRGKATSKNCDDPQNRDRISSRLGTLNINVSPM